MSSTEADAIVNDYFHRLELLLGGLPVTDRVQLLSEIREHITEARAGLAVEDAATVREVLDRLGKPEDIAREALGERKPRWRFAGRQALVAVAVAAVAVVAIVLGLTLGSSSPATRVASAPTAAVGGFPTGIAFDPASNTVYVGSGATSSISLINALTCNASTRSGCTDAKSISSGGQDAIGVVVDDQTGTVYAVNGGSDTVAVINARTCNATDQSGCSKTLASVDVPGGPEFLALNPKTNTIYVADTDAGTVSVIDGMTCNAGDHAGCSKAPATVSVGEGAFPIAVDATTNTVYVGTLAGGLSRSGAGDISVIDGNRCDSTVTSGCAATVKSLSAGSGPAGIALDPSTDTLYVSSESGTVSVINAKTCNGTVATGCARTPATVTVLSDPRGDLLDPATNTLYVTDAGSNSVSMIDTATCNAAATTGCSKPATTFPVGDSPRRIALDPANHALYVVNTQGNDVSIINTTGCNATDDRGCPTEPAAGAAASTGLGTGLGNAPAADSTCSPVTSATTSGAPAATLTAGATQVGTGTIDGMTWSLWSEKGQTGANGLEDAGLVLNGRAYHLCPGYPNPAELELIDTKPTGIVAGVIGYPGRATLKLTTGTTGTFTPGTPLPTPAVHVINGVTFFIGTLPKSACSYPAVELDSTSGSVSAEHNLGFSGCTPNQLVPITFSQGIWQLPAGQFVNNFGTQPSSPLGRSGGLVTTFETCSPATTNTQSGDPAHPLISGSTQVAAGTVDGRAWSLWASKTASGADGIETGGVVVDNRWYGLCPGPPNPAEFELIDMKPAGIVYGFVANPGPYTISFDPGPTLGPTDLRRVRGGTFFIDALPHSACSYSSLQLDASTPSVDDLRYQAFGTCQSNKLVAVGDSHGSW